MQQRSAERIDQSAGSLQIGRNQVAEVDLGVLDPSLGQRKGSVPARQHAAGVDPGCANLWVAVWRLPAEKGLAQIAQLLDQWQQLLAIGYFGAKRANG